MQADWCPGNQLVNPSFEEGARLTESLGTSLSSSVANGWFPWFIRGDQRFNREPEFKLEDATRDPLRYRVQNGYFSQKFFTTWATHTAGVYQRAAVPPGSTVRFSAWVQIYTGEADGWDGEKHRSDPDEPGNYRAWVGIDPYGNTPIGVGAPPPETIMWSAPTMTYDDWTQLSVQAVAQADHVAVYTRGQPEFAVKHNDSFWDTACLTVVGATATDRPTVPAAGTLATLPVGADAVVDTPLLNFRAGPGTEYVVVGALRAGDPLQIDGQTEDGAWLKATDSSGTSGWVFTDLVRLGLPLTGVPVVEQVPPTPTLEPTATATLTPWPTSTSTATTISTPTAQPTAVATATSAATPNPTTSPPAVTPQEDAAPLLTAAATSTLLPEEEASTGSEPSSALPLNCAVGVIGLSVGLLALALWPSLRLGSQRQARPPK